MYPENYIKCFEDVDIIKMTELTEKILETKFILLERFLLTKLSTSQFGGRSCLNLSIQTTGCSEFYIVSGSWHSPTIR